ncbi:flagellar motor switch protein FliG [Pelomicrobium sp. G1]|uniref:flagellar motor switch protein FliG n=1 Tax=unclassified Pelomicrobium TaxID=2815318 RepID=UPI003F75CE3C
MKDEGLEKSAILLMSLGEEEAAQVLKYLSPREVQKLGATMARLKAVPKERVDAVLDEFKKKAEDRSTLALASDEYIRAVLTKALGDEKAAHVIDRILQGGDTSGIESLKWMDSASVAELIRNEHPQVIATILVHLDRDQAGEVIGNLPERLRSDVILRIATLDGVQPAAIKELNEVLAKLLTGNASLRKTAMGGVRAAAEILNFMPTIYENAVIESVREHDAELAQRILDEMFVFEDLLELEDRAIQLLLREVQSESLIVALKGSSDALKEKIFKNMSQRAAELLREDLEAKGPVRVSEVEAEQKEILKIVRRLADAGQIVLGGAGEDTYV